MKYSKYSAVIIGSGIAGLYAALKIEQEADLADGLLVVTKSKLNESNSYYAQGGIVAVLKENKNDTIEAHVTDTIKAGAGLGELNTVKFISENSDKVIKDLIKFGVKFDTDETGKFTLTREAAHSINRILHCGGDATGRKIETALCNALQNNKNIKVYENTLAVELLTTNNTDDDRQLAGLIVYNDDTKEYEVIYSKTVILATGGLGQVYKYTTNPAGATGDGYALAYNAGAVLRDMEFVQFHPTVLAFDNPVTHNRFLISEAVRGEGAKLCDKFGVQFMKNYHEKCELAPRDIVARAIYSQMNNNDEENVFLNAAPIGKQKLLKRFPTIAKECNALGIDITEDYIPVAPAAHYFMGGVKTNIHGETSIKGLYAIGEVSSTGLHGANRLASNSLLECVVCAYETAHFLKNSASEPDMAYNTLFNEIIDKYEKAISPTEEDIDGLKTELQDTMWSKAGIFRDEKGLTQALETIDKIIKKFDRSGKCASKAEYELKNMLICARLIVVSALKRKESRGAHYRSDYPDTDDVCRHSILGKKEGELNFVK